MNVLIGQHEGLPNIIGKVGIIYGNNSEGALIFKKLGVTSNAYGDSFDYGYINLDASKGETKVDGTFKNDVYGKSDHLQTNNITFKYLKRIA